jgi:hypothetical protein
MRKKSTGYGIGVKNTGSAKGCRGESIGYGR